MIGTWTSTYRNCIKWAAKHRKAEIKSLGTNNGWNYTPIDLPDASQLLNIKICNLQHIAIVVLRFTF